MWRAGRRPEVKMNPGVEVVGEKRPENQMLRLICYPAENEGGL